jgi:hypothetical protein
MVRPEENYMLDLWEKNICPQCGNSIPEGKRVGSGKRSEGGFCSLNCYAEYYRLDLIERAKKLASVAARHQNS